MKTIFHPLYLIVLFFLYLSICTPVFSQDKEPFEVSLEYNIPVYWDFGPYYFDKNLELYKVKANELDKCYYDKASIIMRNFLESYSKELIANTINSIYLLQDLELSNEEYPTLLWGNSFYISFSYLKYEYSDELLLENLHMDFASLIFDKYRVCFQTEEWEAVNMEMNTEYDQDNFSLDSISLLEKGYLSKESINDIKEDFICYSLAYHNNSDYLEQLSIKYGAIKNKLDILKTFLNSITNEVYYSETIDTRINELQEKFGVSIIYDFDINSFPSLWHKEPYNAIGTQMDESNIILVLDQVEAFLRDYGKYYVKDLLQNIFLVGGMVVDNSRTDARLNLSSLYISDNFIDTSLANGQFLIDLSNEYFTLFYKNMYSYFPKHEWETLNNKVSAGKNVFLSEKAEERFYYDFRDFFQLQLNDTITAHDNELMQKNNLFKEFINYTDSLLTSLSFQGITQSLKEIENINSVQIYYKSIESNMEFAYIKPPMLLVEDRINKLQLYRYIKVLESFYTNCPEELSKKYIQKVFLYGGLRYHISKNYIGGTYKAETSSLYLVNIGNEFDFLLGAIYHELSSIVLLNNPDLFPKEEWLAVNGGDFKYQKTRSSKDLFVLDKSLHEKGFLNQYSTTYFENDYNEFSKMYFQHPSVLKDLASKYDKIKCKYQMIDRFYMGL